MDERPQNDLERLTSIVLCIHKVPTLVAEILVSFAQRPAIFEMQACRESQNSEKHRMILNT